MLVCSRSFRFSAILVTSSIRLRSPLMAGKSNEEPRRVADSNLSRQKIKGKIQKRSSKSASKPRPTTSTTRCRSVQKKNPHVEPTKKSSKSASKPRPTTSATRCRSVQKKNPQVEPTKKDQQMHRLLFEGGLPDGSVVAYHSRGKRKLNGYKLGRGIFCGCCTAEISPSQFEAHAGYVSRKKPYEHIFLSNGMSLHQYAYLLKLGSERLGGNDAVCSDCEKDGDLLKCNGCVRSYHKECTSETITLFGKWFCPHCLRCIKSLKKKAKNLAAGGVLGANVFVQMKCSIRIIDNPDKHDLVACVLCRSHRFSEAAFNDQTVIVCEQCEKEYHIGCLREQEKADLKALPAGDWFCCVDCSKIYSVLKYLVTLGPEKVPNSLMGVISKKWKDNGDSFTNLKVEWILLKGKGASDESKLLLKEVVDIFHDCFDPVVNPRTGKDYIPLMAYGREGGGADYGGVHCAMLTIDSRVVTAGMFRVLGEDVAELPFVATGKSHQEKGYFQLFFTCFERVLTYLNVKTIILPAAEETKAMWINKMGFDKVTPMQLSEYRQTLTSMVHFERTTMLEKEIPKGRATFEDGVDFSLSRE